MRRPWPSRQRLAKGLTERRPGAVRHSVGRSEAGGSACRSAALASRLPSTLVPGRRRRSSTRAQGSDHPAACDRRRDRRHLVRAGLLDRLAAAARLGAGRAYRRRLRRHLDHLPRHLRARRRRLDLRRHEVPGPARRRRGREADPRSHGHRDPLDGDSHRPRDLHRHLFGRRARQEREAARGRIAPSRSRQRSSSGRSPTRRRRSGPSNRSTSCTFRSARPSSSRCRRKT